MDTHHYIAAIAIILITLALTNLTSIRRHLLKLPPGPAGWPIVGNLLQLSSLPHRDMAAMCKQYGPLVYLRLGTVDAITTNDPDIIKEILLKQDDVFASRPTTVAATHLAYNSRDVAFAPLGPHWKHMRRICMEHLLTNRRLDSFLDHRRQEASCMVAHVLQEAACMDSHVVNLRKILGAFSMNNVTRMLLGKRYFGGDAAEAADFMDITHELFWLLGVLYIGDFLPLWRRIDLHGYEKRMQTLERRMDAFHSRILHDHRKGGAAAATPDFVHVLLSLPGLDGTPRLDDVEIKALVQDMIAAATDTSSVTNEWAMAEVIKQPRILEKIHEELDRVVGRERVVEESDLGELQYLRCVVRETFRTHPAGPFLIPHESVVDTSLGGFHVPAGTRVFINTYALGQNTKVWDRVEEFLPERHMVVGCRVEISHGPDFKILPFSAGKRKCPGAPLGVCFVLLGLARLFHAFHWVAPPGDEIDIREVYGVTMPKASPLLAIPTPRLPSHLYA